MTVVTTETSTDIELPASGSLADSVLCYGLMQDRDVTLIDAGKLSLSDGLVDFLERLGCSVESCDGTVNLCRSGDPDSGDDPVSSVDADDFFRKLAVLSRSRFDLPLRLPDDIGSGFETELIMYRRMGFDYELLDGGRSRICSPTLAPEQEMKYELPEKNYHLLEPLIAGVMSSGCTVELTSPAEIDTSLWDTLPILGVKISSIQRDVEEDELARRMSRLRPGRAEFKYIIQRVEISDDIRIRLPGDHLLGLFVAGAVCLARGPAVKLRKLMKTRSVLSAFKMLERMGAGISVKDLSGDRADPRCEITIRPRDLVGKRFGGESLRASPEAFCVAAALGMIAEGKTVIRDLPFGSELWRKRVGHVREILHLCGARIGEVEDGLVVESGNEVMMVAYVDTGDELCELLQQMLSLAVPHHSNYRDPDHFGKSRLFELYTTLGT